jgi:hypothetical protein
LEVSGQLHAPADLPPGKEPPVPIGEEVWVDLRAGLDDLEKRKFVTPPGLELGWNGVDWIDVAQDRDLQKALVNTIMNLRIP